MKKNINKGVAIFVTMALLFLLSATVVSVLLTAYNYNNICEKQIKSIKLRTSAEAGISYAYYQIRNDAITNFTTDHKGVSNADIIAVGNNGAAVRVWVEDVSPPVTGKYIVKSKAVY